MNLTDKYIQKTEEIKKGNPFISNTELVYELVIGDISNGSLKLGERLKQELLAECYNVSRSSVRDALIKLESEGFVTHNETGGFYVCQINLKDYIDFNNFRQIIEAKSAFLMARIATMQERQLLVDNLNQTKDACSNASWNHIHELDQEFHTIIVNAPHNKYLISAYENYSSRRNFYNKMVLSETSLPAIYNKHDRIASAILSNNEEAAYKAMESHLSIYTLIYNLTNIQGNIE